MTTESDITGEKSWSIWAVQEEEKKKEKKRKSEGGIKERMKNLLVRTKLQRLEIDFFFLNLS